MKVAAQEAASGSELSDKRVLFGPPGKRRTLGTASDVLPLRAAGGIAASARVDMPVIVVWLAVVFLALPLLVFFQGGAATHWLWSESGHGLVESVSAGAWLVAALLLVCVALLSHNLVRGFSVIMVAWAVFAFGEETSWLQQYLQYATPAAIADANLQREFNIHNLQVLAGKQGNWARGLLSAQMLFFYAFCAYFLVLPALASLRRHRLLGWLGAIPHIGRNLLLFTWLPIVTCIALGLLSAARTHEGLAEVREMFYATAFLAFAVAFIAATVRRRATLRGR